ncbi:MAG: Rieske 2Fe-2S domain-containing protein [Actinomycetota bacterium]|nr:Rieske 2Fe-2S domain-containing protein [Actinomycetota bacterium]
MVSQQFDDFALPDEGELVSVDVEGTPVAVTVLDGEVHAFDDTCPHAGCSLAEGELEDDSVVCPCHFARFDITTGAVVEGSAKTGVGVWSARFRDGVLQLQSPGGTPPPAEAPAPAAQPGSAGDGPDRDITVLIQREHDSFRRQFTALDELSDPDELQRAWRWLADLLEIHASGEEVVLYPRLVRADEDAVEEAEHAVRDHDEIRDSVRAVQQHPVGSPDWRQAVRTAGQVNEEHLQEEERDVLPAFRHSVDRAAREQLGAQWVTFHAEHEGAQGLSHADTDPRTVLERADP